MKEDDGQVSCGQLLREVKRNIYQQIVRNLYCCSAQSWEARAKVDDGDDDDYVNVMI